jgi:predicted nucleic acid-binding protein
MPPDRANYPDPTFLRWHRHHGFERKLLRQSVGTAPGSRYLLDTNIISNVVKPRPPEPLLAWMSARHDEDLFIAALAVAEIRRGILENPRGKKRDMLKTWFSGPEGPQALPTGRILSFDDETGLIWAELMAKGKTSGQPRSGLDMIIAAVAAANGCVVLTDNERDFAGLRIVNPMRGAL